MQAIEPYLVALKDGDAKELHLRAGDPPYWRVGEDLVANGDPLPGGAAFDTMLLDLLVAGRVEGMRLTRERHFAVQFAGARFHVDLFPCEEGNNAVIRRVSTEVPPPDELRMPDAVRRLSTLNSGLVLVCGSLGSGKTTTVASLLDAINGRQTSHIVTVERPVEFVLTPKSSVVHQIQVGSDTATHAAGVRTALAAQAEVVLVDDLPDEETAQHALEAADRGALVFVTLDCNGATQAVDRVLTLLPDDLSRSRLADNLQAVVYQMLLPRTDGGFVAAHEVLVTNRSVQAALREGRARDLAVAFQSGARTSGMRTIDQALEELIRAGEVDREEALRRAHRRSAVEQKVT